jgi:hypothetical protein
VADGGGAAAHFWLGTHLRGVAIGPAMPWGEGDELDSAWRRDWPATVARGKLRRDGQDRRASDGKEKLCAARSATKMEEEGMAWTARRPGRGLGRPPHAVLQRGLGRSVSEQSRVGGGGGGQRRDITRTARVLSERRRLRGPAQGQWTYGSAHEETVLFSFYSEIF